jgi:hypothetical protein
LQHREQRGGAVPDVVVGALLGVAGLHRQRPSSSPPRKPVNKAMGAWGARMNGRLEPTFRGRVLRK